MGNFMTSLLGYKNPEHSQEELTLENAYKLLQHVETQKPSDNDSLTSTSENLVCTKTGTITEKINDTYIIDDLYVFTTTDTKFEEGSKVSYNLFFFDDISKVSNVELVSNEWDSVESSNSLWSSRILISQVVKREGRKLTLTSDVILDLDKVSLQFLPIVGDWLELDVKCIVNEKSLDLTGGIIEINKISPIRIHLETGKITNWKLIEEHGTINNKIYFNKSALSIGYLPVLGDKVVAEVIESSQNRYSWRAIKIVPDQLSSVNEINFKTSVNISDCIENYPGLDVTNVNIVFNKLGETKTFYILILNCSESKYKLVAAEFVNPNGQCHVLSNNLNLEILPGQEQQILCECTSKNIGTVKEFFTLNFGEFTIGKWANIQVLLNHNNQRIDYEYKSKLQPYKESSNECIKGQTCKGPRFIVVQIPIYVVPQRLMDARIKCVSKNNEEIIQELKTIKPSLVSNLTALNYEDKFHTLVYLDEITNLIAIRVYDQDKACFIKNAEYLMLEIDNLSERRPSIIIGDKIIATDSLQEKGLDYEGIVHKVGARHVYLKFNQLFHEDYNGEDYSIRVVPARSNYRRTHHAIYLASRNLGPELLFPMKISEKDIQIDFYYNSNNVVTSPNSIKVNKMKQILSKMQEYKQNSILNTSVKDNTHKMKLEWYNNGLNPTQKNAVINVLWGKARPLPYVIFGPPGTGKTVTLIEIILQIVRLLPSSRLLIAAPSNSAADLIALRLINSGVLRPGDLVRVVSYTYAMSDMIPVKLVPYCATTSAAKEGTYIEEFTTNSNGIQLGCNQSVLGRHRITVATCGATGQFFNMGFPKGHFSHIIVDEAAQVDEPEIMIPLSFVDKANGQIILAGDPMQLGPVVLCKIASQCGLSESYLERLINRFPYVHDPEGYPETSGFDPRLVTKLLYNYRALPDVLNLYNSLFYNNELIPTIDENDSAEAAVLDLLKEILPRKIDGKLSQILFHGVDGENYQTEDSPSWFNPHEAAQVFYYVNEFYRLGIKSSQLAIISPYVKQVKEIRSLFNEAEFDVPKMGTVEEFQGQEYNIVIMSTVRSQEEHISKDVKYSLGFVTSPKRLNVAISRCKSLLIIIGNPKLLSFDGCWRYVIKYCMEMGCYTGCEF